MGLLDRFRSIFTPLTAPELEVDVSGVGPTIDAHTSTRASHVTDVDPNNLVGGSARGGGYLQSASALFNMFTGQGTSRDPSSFNLWATPRYLRYRERFGMGRNALIQQALGKLPNTATREGWRVLITEPTVEDKQGVSDQIDAYEQRLQLGQRINRALFRGRQHSYAMVVLGIDDGRTFDLPVDVDNIRTIRWAVTIDARDFYPEKLADATSEDYGKIEIFKITDINGILEDGLRYGENSISYTETEWQDIFDEQRARQGGQLRVHSDRVLFFPTPDYFSLLDSLQDSLGAFFETMGGIRSSARESSMFKYKIAKNKQKMWSANANLAAEHMGLVQKMKSTFNAFVHDEDEDVSVLSRPTAGLADLANPIMAWVAAALAIPNTIFWQVSPGGFGKGEAERDTWHEDTNAFQDQVLTPELTKAHGYILAASDGPQLPTDTQRTIEYNDLTPPDEVQKSKLRSDALSDLRQLHKDNVITRPEIRTAIEPLNDEYFRLELDSEFVDKPSPAQVGIFTGSVALLTALFGEGNIPPEAGQALLLALDPVHFTPANIQTIIPIAAAETGAPDPGPASGEDPSGSDPGAGPELLPGDEEDAQVEPSDVEIMWSQVETPAGARTAKELEADSALQSDGVKSRNIKQLAREGKLTAYKPRGFSKEPLFLLEEVQRALLERQGHMAQPDVEPAQDAGPRALFISIYLPAALARWVPYKSGDSSPPHVTLAYVKDVPQDVVADVLNELRQTFESYDPIDMAVQGEPVHYFETKYHGTDAGRVAYAQAAFMHAQETFDDIAEALESFDLTVEHRGVYSPHVTLAYLDGGEVYNGPSPDGHWTASAVEVSYAGEVVETMTLDGRLMLDGVEVGDGHERREDNTFADPDHVGAASDRGPLIKEGYIWRTQGDSKVRSSHARLNGKRFRPNTGDSKEGQPGDAPNCRCAKETIVPPKGTKRAQSAAQRTVRRALRQNFKRISGPKK